jgi:hypothetical protein
VRNRSAGTGFIEPKSTSSASPYTIRALAIHQPARVGQVPRALLVHHDLRAAEHRGDVAHAARVVQVDVRDHDGSEVASPDPERGKRGLHDRRRRPGFHQAGPA